MSKTLTRQIRQYHHQRLLILSWIFILRHHLEFSIIHNNQETLLISPWTSVHERTVRGGRRRRCVGVVVVLVVVGSSTVIQHPAAAAHLQQRLTIVTFLYTKVTPTLSVCSHHHHQRAPSLHTCANTAVLHTSAHVWGFKRYFSK